jgi:hypothetical protein
MDTVGSSELLMLLYQVTRCFNWQQSTSPESLDKYSYVFHYLLTNYDAHN